MMRPRLFLCAAAMLLGACASVREAGFGDRDTAVELAATPFYPQERYQCGPAALMTVLEMSGAAVTLDELVEAVYLPDRQGSLQAEIISASRAAGRIPYRVDGSLGAIAAQLDAGLPVLVLQNLGIRWYPTWHYAVVYGVDPVAGNVWLRSGTTRERETRATTFLRTWQRGDYWGLVTLKPGELPANPDPNRYFSAVASLEETGHLSEARTAWQAAHKHWPDEVVPLFGLANTELAIGNPQQAADLYRKLINRSPQNALARNNYAHALAALGKQTEAITELETALALPGLTDSLRAELEDSLERISQNSPTLYP